MSHDSVGSRKNNLSELSRWQKVDNPLFDLVILDVESWGDDTTFVESSVKFNDDLSGSVVIDQLEFTDVT